MDDFNKASLEKQAQPISTPFPTPRTYEGVEYYGADDVAKIIGVTRRNVLYWHQQGLFLADKRAHDGRYLYTVERVEQLKSVYHPKWMRGGYEPSPADDDATNAQIRDDIKQAQANIFNLPEKDRRGLAIETFQYFGFGFLKAWRHPKMPNSQPTDRIIVPLGDRGSYVAYNAILTPAERERLKPLRERDKPPKYTDKCLTAGSKLVFNPADLTCPIVAATEGEIDCASLWQAVQRGKKLDAGNEANFAGFVALGGTGGASKDLYARLQAAPTKPKMIVLFDADQREKQPGQKESTVEKILRELRDIGVVAVAEFLDDFMSDDDKKSIGGKVDANAILQHFGEDKLYRVFARVVAKAKADFPKAEEEMQGFKAAREAAKNQHDDRPRDLSPEITDLIARIKDDVPISRLVEKGYLQHSQRGNAHPKGYCCPWCGSGTRTHKTGALAIFDDRRVGCARCRAGGDVLTVYAEVKNMSLRGSEFFDVLKAIADEFSVSYDPKIFDPPENKSSAQYCKTGNADADAWQAANGFIDKQLYLEIRAAEKFLQELTPETLTATVASSSSTARKIALCTVYDFALEAAQKFWLRLEDAIANAVAQVKTAKTTGEILSDDVRLLAQLTVNGVRKTVDREVKAVQRAHEKFQDKAKTDEAKANRNKRANARKDAHDQKLRELDELSKQPQSNERNSKLVDLLRDVCERKVDSFGNEYGFKNTAANAKLIFMHDPVLDGLIGRDEFQQADVFLKPPPWNDSPLCIGSTFKDSDAAHVRVYLAETYEDFGSVQKIDDMLTVTADKNSFHPVKDWLKNLPAWDGKPRAETLFVDFLRVDDTPFAREVTLNWLTAALARIVYPGCNYQTALVLHGNQGIGKSYILERLGGRWYGVLSDSIDDPHALDTINSLWICELKEFRAARKADVNTLKAFIDTAVDTRRAAYERRPKPYPRHVVFGITVNDDGFLNDLTGNRRFPILECKSTRGEYVEGLTDEYVAQVWAEVKAKFKEKFFVNGKMIQDLKVVGKLLELSREAKRQVEAVAEKFLRDDGLANEIQGCLDKPIPPQVIWLTLTRNERRRFMDDAKIYVGGGKRELERRIKSRTQRKSSIDSDVDELYSLLTTAANDGTLYTKTGDNEALIIFGTELRNHICAAEIRAEFFAPTDKRNNMTRINELLPTIEHWHTGARMRNLDPEYPDQKKVFYRDEPPPDEADKDDAHTEDAPETSHDDFIGEPIDLENPPF
ncbi:MAG: MerR family transcriptional regulator [Selenomonadaceae bacterium]|nr:MerR family transcriptional regulator [Selenomonadaceae bacterium]